jgi:hypothetical protein
MRRLTSVDILREGDFIKAFTSQKAIPITETVGVKVGAIELFMEKDFEGFYRADV